MKKTIVSLIVSLILGINLSAQKVINIQPLGDVRPEIIDTVKKSVEGFYGYKCIIKPKVNLTKDILADSKTRYEAGKILRKFNSSENMLIITEKDIATAKGKYHEWGILGLGYRPGTTCVVSTFRMGKNITKFIFFDRLKKVSLHEIGHNLGLEHCTNSPYCMMNDAKGTIKEVDGEKIWLCEKCKKQIGLK